MKINNFYGEYLWVRKADQKKLKKKGKNPELRKQEGSCLGSTRFQEVPSRRKINLVQNAGRACLWAGIKIE